MSDLLLRTCRGEQTARPPVWIMRQAGRFLPEYRQIRARHSFLEVCRTPELAARVTMQPVEALGVDAAILFADILLPLDALGREVRFVKGRGPVIGRPVRHRDQIEELGSISAEQELAYVAEAIRLLRSSLQDRVPLIGFAGTPWTVASYLVAGGVSKHHRHLLAWSWEDPEGLALLLARLGQLTADYLSLQVEAGAQVLQLFDSWGGLLSSERWNQLARPALMRAVERVQGSVPLIYYINGGSHLLDEITTLPVEVVSLDWRVSLPEARRRLPRHVLQGNLDPAALLASPDRVRRLTAELLKQVDGPHILNLGHGILPQTPVESARAFVSAAHQAARNATRGSSTTAS